MSPPERIISLLASGTELVCALGLGQKLVGRSHECDYPEWVKQLPAVSQPTFDLSGSSRDIDRRVRERLHAQLPLYTVDEARLLELAPDVLITQTHCEVCAVSPADLAHSTSAKLERQQLIALRTGTLAAILEGFLEVAAVLGRPEAGHALVSAIRSNIAQLSARTANLAPTSVVCLEWIEPLFAMGNWGPELVEIAGGKSLLGSPGQHSSTTSWAEVQAADPEVLVIAPCGFGLERTCSEVPLLTRQPGWHDLLAVRTRRVFVADGNLYFNRSGPLLFESAEILAEILHPESFPPRHEGSVWRRLDAC